MQGEWFCTGDIGAFSPRGFLKITDRKKELFKTSGGKYVAPLPIESRLKESIYIEQVMVIGADRKFVSALIVPSFPNVQEWARQQGITETRPQQLIQDARVLEHFKELIESFNKFFNPVEQIKKFELLEQEWSVDTGELTPKLSLKRKVVLEKYREAIERIYA
jgi:long-chain acyl-CoA synthetase